MKKNIFKNIIPTIALSLLLIQGNYAQIGIGTTTPEGALDLESSSLGLVYPRVMLTKNNIEAPVINPNGGAIVEGTVVYNTNTTQTGSNDVYPGIYAWNGSKWVPQFIMEEYKKFNQSSTCQRVDINNNETEEDPINGLTSGTFTPKYSGTYKIKVNLNYGAGEMTNFYNDNEISLSTAEGNFYFSLSGLGVNINPNPSGYSYDYRNGWVYTHSYSIYNELQNPDTKYNNNVQYSSLVFHEYLTGGTPYNFNLSISIITGQNFLNNGDSGEGMGHVGHDIPCSVEFTFLND
jgi:hypothetical protein